MRPLQKMEENNQKENVNKLKNYLDFYDAQNTNDEKNEEEENQNTEKLETKE